MSKPTRVEPSDQHDPLALIKDALSGLRFGEITIAVHEGEIVQIARTEKIRTPRAALRAG